ncbi:hypothetical protein [Cedecea colo]|uniref:Cytoplasmic protein n=1 Tax=Cedecea colo TaxID=2552946 RepID=A0ABX0VRE9_9ENTR|nr:hypothetical protein [Cedecea colo]NIY49656.1 hypothetical protein [Cedecea colo]
MSKKATTRKHSKKVVQSTSSAAAVTSAVESELSYDDMLSELEAIVSEADVRLAEEEASL